MTWVLISLGEVHLRVFIMFSFQRWKERERGRWHPLTISDVNLFSHFSHIFLSLSPSLPPSSHSPGLPVHPPSPFPSLSILLSLYISPPFLFTLMTSSSIFLPLVTFLLLPFPSPLSFYFLFFSSFLSNPTENLRLWRVYRNMEKTMKFHLPCPPPLFLISLCPSWPDQRAPHQYLIWAWWDGDESHDRDNLLSHS